MASKIVTYQICQYLRNLWENGLGFKLEYVEAWTEKKGRKVSRQTVSRALRGHVEKMQDSIAKQLAEFIEHQTDGKITSKEILSVGVSALTPKTFTHPVIADNTTLQIQELLKLGLECKNQQDWRQALKFYLDALWIAQAGKVIDPTITHVIYESIGDLYLVVSGESEIARGYYQASLIWTTSLSAKARLLCRIAQTYQNSPWLIRYIEDAAKIIAQAKDTELDGWMHYLNALKFELKMDRQNARHLATQAAKHPHLPDDVAVQASGIALRADGRQRNVSRIYHHTKYLNRIPQDTWLSAQTHFNLAVAFLDAGELEEALDFFQEAANTFDRLGRKNDVLFTYQRMAWVSLAMGAYKETRNYAKRALGLPGREDMVSLLYLCKTYIHDKNPDATQWSSDLLDAIHLTLVNQLQEGEPSLSQYQSVTPLRKLLHRLGLAERIFRDAKQFKIFQDRIEQIKDLLQENGYKNDEIFYLQISDERSELTSVSNFDPWQWEPGSSSGKYELYDRGIRFFSAPLTSFSRMEVPIFFRSVTGDFAIETTIHGGHCVIEDTLMCRKQASKNKISNQAHGGGGLFVSQDNQNMFRLFAHVQAPGEVLCEFYKNGQVRTLGRGLVGDEPIRLRLERRHNTLYAYAHKSDNLWYLCGQVDIPNWSKVKVGLYGEGIADLYSISGFSISELTNICFQS